MNFWKCVFWEVFFTIVYVKELQKKNQKLVDYDPCFEAMFLQILQ